jgi:hypothetical protein
MKQTETPETYMRQVLALAAEALEQGEFPIAARPDLPALCIPELDMLLTWV